jgi:hypothetical protein
MSEDTKKEVKLIKDVLGEDGSEFDVVTTGDLLDKSFTIIDYRAAGTEFGRSVAVTIDDGENVKLWYTGAMVVMKKLDQIKDKQAFPVYVTLVQQKSKAGRIYYNLV